MFERRPKRMKTEDSPHVDHLLGLLSNLSKRDPSPALRERLGKIASQRLREIPDPLRSAGRKSMAWLKPVLALVLLVASGFTAVFVVHSRNREQVQIDRAAKIIPIRVSPDNVPASAAAPRPSVARPPTARHTSPALLLSASARRMTMRLPYSNGAIETGTDATIRVSISQSELLSLGFPINRSVQDRRIVAELTLGDDGLPRAISLPMPLEVIKEKK